VARSSRSYLAALGPLREMAGRVVKEAKTPIFTVVYGPRPSPPTPRFWWRGGGEEGGRVPIRFGGNLIKWSTKRLGVGLHQGNRICYTC
jgi:hypothetical protein